MKTQAFKLFLFIFSFSAFAQWDRQTEVNSPRENILNLPQEVFEARVEHGKRLALFYPVTVSDLLIPYHPLKTFFESDANDPVRQLLFNLARVVSPFKSMPEVYKWLGLHDFPKAVQPETPNALPSLSERDQELPMGATLLTTENGEALTVGCAGCHVGSLFGVKVLGLTNRFPRANEFFRMGQKYAPYINTFLFRDLLKATEGERLMMANVKNTIKWIGSKAPVQLGLDTSLAQVALSLAKREADAYATRTNQSQRNPRDNELETLVADSKPAVWWNVKHKNRWLSDGSIVSGNPVHTNFLWNEIGRGTDLKKLATWMDQKKEDIEALTVAVFANKSPRYEAFFGANGINIEKARRGQKHYVQSCQKCHGTYEKAWDKLTLRKKTKEELIQTVKVRYHKQTPVIDVGTDPGRYQGMRAFASDLNRLKISQEINTVVEPQKGYVPPPLEGIWARWPYLHNNSIPNLCVLLTKGSERPKSYYAGEAIERNRDYDQDCAGYPLGDKTPANWKINADYLYDSSKSGLSNLGHDEGIFLKNGQELYTREEKLELIEFLKTL